MASIIRAQELSKSYRLRSGEVHALRGVTLDIAKGEFVAVMGPSGSGKSTFMNLLGLLDRPSSGRYWLDGQDVSDLKADDQASMRNDKIGFVFQAFNLLPRNTAQENVELPLFYAGWPKDKRRNWAAEVLEVVGLRDRANHWPHQLSGGEQQRVAIARAMANDPVMILADEPTGALDSRTGALVLKIFKALNDAGRTIVLITHDPNVARHAERVIELRDGCLGNDAPASRPEAPEPCPAMEARA